MVSAALNHAFRADTEAKWLTPDAPGLPQVFEDLREEVVEVVDIDRGAPGRPSARFRPGTCEAILLCDDVWLVTLSEEHDVSTEDAIRRVLGRLWRRGCRVLVDLSDVSFIASPRSEWSWMRIVGLAVPGWWSWRLRVHGRLAPLSLLAWMGICRCFPIG